MNNNKPSKRTSNFVMRVSNEDKQMLQQLANEMNVNSVSKAVRKVVKEKLSKGKKQ